MVFQDIEDIESSSNSIWRWCKVLGSIKLKRFSIKDDFARISSFSNEGKVVELCMSSRSLG